MSGTTCVYKLPQVLHVLYRVLSVVLAMSTVGPHLTVNINASTLLQLLKVLNL